ncbi:hypothetical protein ID866_4243 [Astraeus odoratus]|nr:hypothetical protein ID866_4243 [Astraeus odoratus]
MNKTDTDKIRLLLNPPLDFEPGTIRAHTLADFWELLRSNCLEPGQTSEPLLTFFLNKTLLYALVLRKPSKNNVPKGPETSGSQSSGLTLVPSHTSDTRLAADASASSSSQSYRDDAIGFVYVYSSPANVEGEVNVGIVIRKDMQRRGYARDAMELVLEYLFEGPGFHRVQAAVLDMQDKDQALLFFTALGFMNEGTRRRSVRLPDYQGGRGEWKDVTYLAMLDTDWVVRKPAMVIHNPPSTIWDEMVKRHSREREELVEWEERHGGLKRPPSTEMIDEDTPSSKKAGKLKTPVVDSELPYSSHCVDPSIHEGFSEEKAGIPDEGPSSKPSNNRSESSCPDTGTLLHHPLRPTHRVSILAHPLALIQEWWHCLQDGLTRGSSSVSELLLSTPPVGTPPIALSCQADGGDAVDFVYVYANVEGEVNVGVVIHKDMKREGYARDTMELALGYLFEGPGFHRVQAAVLDIQDKDQTLLFFTALAS